MTTQKLLPLVVLKFFMIMAVCIPPVGPASAAPLVIDGADMTCQDFRGRSVQTMEVSELGDVGRAWVVNTVPYIIMDPDVLRRLPVKLQLFFFAHECAHHVLAHWFNPSRESEKEADCWAVRHGRDRALFTRQDVADFAPWFAASKGSHLGHLPGPERASFLLTCFDTPMETASQR
ncbi:MAG: hypothetical protein NW217_09300 [Hyphomicrobiaceae bacterium]|nr:hypothetical protein [Hyphomicrobiaceae bacterium]